MKIKKSWFYFLVIIFVALFGVKALFHPGFYTSHDGRHQIIRLMHFHKGLVDGQLPVRWAGTALSGYGYPLFVFTYRLPFWIAEGWYLFSRNLGEAIKFAFILTYIASGLTMYIFLRKLWSSKVAGLLGSLLYLWAPYRFLDIYVRAALGEATTFVFLPLIFLAIFCLTKERKKFSFWTFVAAFSLAGLLLSHAIALWLWLIPLGGWFIFNFLGSKEKKEYLTSVFTTGLFSLFLTVYYWLPAMAERKYVKFSGALGDYYKAHFVTLKQLLYSKWGYGFSMPGVSDDMMSFQVGIAQWGVVVSSFLFLLVYFLLYSGMNFCSFSNRARKKSTLKIKSVARRFLCENCTKIIPSPQKVLLFWQFIFFISIYLMLGHSDWFYKLSGRVFTVDIPWRFLSVSIFASSVLFAGLVKLLKDSLLKWGFIFLVLFLAFYGNRNHLRVNKYIYVSDQEYWQSTETSNEYEDYTPRWFESAKFDQKDPQLITVEGISTNRLQERKSNFFRFTSEVKSQKAQIVTKVAFYPGWQMFVDGQKKEISHKDGRIKVDLQKGNHLVTLLFRETNLINFCNWLSFLILIMVVLVAFLARLRK